jgi:hypothetical protein
MNTHKGSEVDGSALLSVEILLADLARQRFFGSIELKYEAGHIVLIRRTETIKPGGQDCRNNRGEHDEQQERPDRDIAAQR